MNTLVSVWLILQIFLQTNIFYALSFISHLPLITFFFVCWYWNPGGHLFCSPSSQFSAFSCCTESSWDIQGDIKAGGLPSQIPQVSRPGPWLISGKIHPVLSHKTLDQGWRDWLMRWSAYLLCRLNMSAGGWLTYCTQCTVGRLIRSNYQ